MPLTRLSDAPSPRSLRVDAVQVRLRVVATRIDASEIFAIGTIKDEYLGLIE